MTITKIQSEGLVKPVDLADNEQIRLGTGNDLKLYHGGTNSIIQNDTGDLYQKNANNLFIQVNGNEAAIYARTNGSVELYHDNVKKFETRATDCRVYDDLKLEDNLKIKLGTADDLELYHNGSHSYIENVGTGNLYIKDAGIVKIASDSFKVDNSDETKQVIKCNPDAGIELYYNNSKKFETTGAGATVTGTLNLGSGDLYLTGNIDFDDSTGAGNNRIKLGYGDDFQIYHDGNDSYVDVVGVGGLRIESDQTILRSADSSETYISTVKNGAVELYHDNSKKLETASGGINITNSGAIYLGGTGSSNALYDYEKGTFTPRFHGNGNNNTITTSTNVGEYVKVGRLVYVKIRVIFTDRNGANSTLAMDGLPFSNAGNHTCTNLGRWANVQNHSVVGAFSGHIGDGSQEIEFNCLTSTGASGSDVNQTTDTTTVMLGFSYPAWGQ
tara:strand:+ start:1440 stop:2768 length:1329 start_codon:yes stop_codon:yes gene_type:complete